MTTVLFALASLLAPAFLGFSSYAAMHPGWPCERFLEISDHAAQPAMAVLWGKFGDSTLCLEGFANRYAGRHHLIEYHLYHDPSRRQADDEWLAEMAARIDQIRLVAERIGNSTTHSVLSIGLEDRLDDKSAAKLVRVARDHWPYLLVRSSIVSRNPAGADYRETHGTSRISSPCFANNDGSFLRELGLRQFKASHAGCYAVFLWAPHAQGWERPGRTPANTDRNYRISDDEVAMYSRLLSTNK